MIKKFPTDCCALCQLSMSNETSFDEIRATLTQLKQEAYAQDYLNTDKTMGQKAAFVITTPSELLLVDKLIMFGFKRAFHFERREGYEPGILTMWFINL